MVNLQKDWRWNGKPLRVRITHNGQLWWSIIWQRWHPKRGWLKWRAHVGYGQLRDVLPRYRESAERWRGLTD